MKTYSKEGTPLAEALLAVESLAKVLAHPDLQSALYDQGISDAAQNSLALAARFLPQETLTELPYDALQEAYHDLPAGCTWQELLGGCRDSRLSDEDFALAERLATALKQVSDAAQKD
ncbi:hypothetical protein F6X40_09595 [Paraburkholderia sp. UCT31]|uniref:hypothetical protein n=1 Tax=Paraburkholderia sp. UCT31 TaxID=2615209 RepID=UPI001655F45B|nr:hypothetical protein [Paraburkholderia sp. UCT31]MBC8737061.1 hypothetical protein [Paraburkholderia sp. UCT31]